MYPVESPVLVNNLHDSHSTHKEEEGSTSLTEILLDSLTQFPMTRSPCLKFLFNISANLWSVSESRAFLSQSPVHQKIKVERIEAAKRKKTIFAMIEERFFKTGTPQRFYQVRILKGFCRARLSRSLLFLPQVHGCRRSVSEGLKNNLR